MIKVGIIGATGYAGLELVRILMRHPEVEITAISSVSFTGQKLSDVYPSMRNLVDTDLVDDREVIATCDVVFASLPHGLSQDYAKECDKSNKIFIDLGADFRLHNEDDYKMWYSGTFDDKALHEKAVYALPELFREDIKGSKLISNPGCYPTSAALGLAPIMKNVKKNSILIDAKSGTTGAGRGLSQNTHFPDCNENFAPYKIAEHRHIPEIEQTLSVLSGEDHKITFVPHLLPVNRGILSTIYLETVESYSLKELHKIYENFYKDEQFVRVLPLGSIANIKSVAQSNFCDISVHMDTRTGRLIIVSAIDNMVKGASGQAVQNMNIVCGFKENTALDFIPPAF